MNLTVTNARLNKSGKTEERRRGMTERAKGQEAEQEKGRLIKDRVEMAE